ncbi:MAG: mismatch repair protein Vsr [Rariglobus sp.]|jgi:DNA mismatch endonuclease (patch repair protein)|nr:mismatch repair protein Vsr [Rariglobus sp.]
MSDILTVVERSALMSRIRGSGNKDTELKLMAVFRLHGVTGWRRKAPVFGKPDFVFPKLKLAVFVDGCFWHGCPIHATQPKQNAEFWRTKIARNLARDRLVTRTLLARGWHVLRIWEHELTRKYERRLLARLRRAGLLV